MKRFMSYILLLFCSLFSFFAAFYVFFPMDAALGLIWQKGVIAAAERVVTLESAVLGVEGYLPLRFFFRNVRLVAPVASAEAGILAVQPLFIESVASMAPTAAINIENFTLSIPIPGQPPIAFSTFYSKSSFRSSGTISLSGIATEGDLEITGDMLINTLTAKLDEADISISGERSALLEYAKTMLPLQKEASGKWFLRRKGGENK